MIMAPIRSIRKIIGKIMMDVKIIYYNNDHTKFSEEEYNIFSPDPFSLRRPGAARVKSLAMRETI
jgi:hypothetical protein